jgi:imidazolonepropionase-like amidohydrolase
MKSMTAAALVALCAFVAAPAFAATEYLELVDFHLIDGTGTSARTVQHLVARDGVLVQIDEAGRPPTPEPRARWTRIDLDGAWVMPGLIDTHVHVARFPDTRAKAGSILHEATLGGVTAVRDMAGDARSLAELSRAVGTGELVAPTLVYSALFGGPDIFRQGPTAEMSRGLVPGQAPWAHVVTADSDLRQLVAEAKGSGATSVKVYGDLSPALAAALIREARRQHLRTAAHATVFTARPGDLVDAGVGSLAHAPYLVWEAADEVPDDYAKRIDGPWDHIAPDHPRLRALYRSMAEHGTTLDATLYVYKEMATYPGLPKMDWMPAAFAWGAEATRLAREAGVLVTTGTDWFEPRDETELVHTHEELALLVEAARFTPLQAIVAGTHNGAVALGIEDVAGTVEVGKYADLLVLEANPLEDIRNTRRIAFTVLHGTIVDPRE